MNDPCCLVLDDGVVYEGRSFGAAAPTPDELEVGSEPLKGAGEVVFNTGMCGYHEILTDPSYTGQIVTMTYPMIGNYGDSDDWSEVGPESQPRASVKAAGFVVRSLYTGPVPARRESLNRFLIHHDTPGITNVDTRGLTLRIRDGGSANGVIVSPASGTTLTEAERKRCLDFLARFPRMEGRNLIGGVGSGEAVTINEDGSPSFVLVDCGIKANIIRELESRGCRVTLLPSGVGPEEILAAEPDAVLYSNGPGDPAELEAVVEAIKSLIGKTSVFGICLGHQLISQAVGATTRKMKFGHHGVNHPVRDELTKRVFVTSQNHGFDVVEESLPSNATIWFKNANDGTIEGIRLDDVSVLTAQFHPEAAPGPADSSWIFDEFVAQAGKGKS